MDNNFCINAPANSTSLGQTTINILLSLYNKGLEPAIHPISNVDLSCYNFLTDDFKKWLESGITKSRLHHKKTHPCFKLWHINGSDSSLSYKQCLFTFHETDRITDTEKQVLSLNDSVIVSSKYTSDVFAEGGIDSKVVNLGFDNNSFKTTNRKYFPDHVISMGLVGKLENRKRHLQVLKYWASKYGNNTNFVLNCAIFNGFIKPEEQQRMIGQALGGKNYINITFNPFMGRNDAYNDYLNSNKIVIGMSGGEGFGLPEFQSVALGKHGVMLDATGYKQWANTENCTLVQPSGKSNVYDNIFFREGDFYNQGQIFDWDEAAFDQGLTQAISNAQINPVNKKGFELQDKFRWSDTTDAILSEMEKLA